MLAARTLAAPLALTLPVAAALAQSPAKSPAPRIDLKSIGAPPFLTTGERAETPWAGRLRVSDPAVDGLVAPPRYSIGRQGSAATGRQATVSFGIGETRVMAIGGKLEARPRSPAQAARSAQERAGLAASKLETGKLYGGGLERKLGPIEVGAQYLYSTISADELDPTSAASAMGLRIDPKSSSHSVRATARLRFR